MTAVAAFAVACCLLALSASPCPAGAMPDNSARELLGPQGYNIIPHGRSLQQTQAYPATEYDFIPTHLSHAMGASTNQPTLKPVNWGSDAVPEGRKLRQSNPECLGAACGAPKHEGRKLLQATPECTGDKYCGAPDQPGRRLLQRIRDTISAIVAADRAMTATGDTSAGLVLSEGRVLGGSWTAEARLRGRKMLAKSSTDVEEAQPDGVADDLAAGIVMSEGKVPERKAAGRKVLANWSTKPNVDTAEPAGGAVDVSAGLVMSEGRVPK